jgi:hypothetical protein
MLISLAILLCSTSYLQPCNSLSIGFISIEMSKIVVGSPSLTQPLLLYSSLGPAMLDNIGGVNLVTHCILLIGLTKRNVLLMLL